MTLALHAFTYLVRDYDEAIQWFTSKLGFQLVEDTALGDDKRWVRVAARPGGPFLLLAKAQGAEQMAAIGTAAGGRVAYFLHCDDFASEAARMRAAGIRFREHPRHESYGTVAVFEDLYGNGWDLIEPRKPLETRD
jgi:catechol 2,3-dioxygenase-like lactoylglutathione lyase family enzyme